MKKKLSWEALIGFACICFFIKFILGDITGEAYSETLFRGIGDAFTIGGIILLVMAYITFRKSKKVKMDKEDVSSQIKEPKKELIFL